MKATEDGECRRAAHIHKHTLALHGHRDVLRVLPWPGLPVSIPGAAPVLAVSPRGAVCSPEETPLALQGGKKPKQDHARGEQDPGVAYGADGRSGGEELPADIKRSVQSPANNPGSFQALQRHSSLTGAALHDNQA